PITIRTQEFTPGENISTCLHGLLADIDIVIVHSVLKKTKIISTVNLDLMVLIQSTNSLRYST
ncbi:hypothetical protein BgiMline_031521, partial [Biomphalaria glabrata]